MGHKVEDLKMIIGQTNGNSEMLFKEYEICTKEASRLESNIWQTATLFSIGSGIGLTYFLKEFLITKGNYSKLELVVPLFAFFSIIVSLVWWRMAKRWWSIQHLKYERMREIEKILGFRQISIVNERDNETMQHIKSYRFLYWFRYQIPKNITAKKCDDIVKIKNHEHRGIQPAISFLILANAILWISMILISCRTIQVDYRKGLIEFIILTPLILVLLFLFLWRKH